MVNVKAANGTRIGVLALQGDFERHVKALERLGVEAQEVREPEDLKGLSGLVLPGGESTAMLKLMEGTGMEDAIRSFHEKGGALFGTCAGLILIADRVSDPAQRSLRLLDVDVDRNAYGRQADSFEADVETTIGRGGPLRAVFIRAPRVTRQGPEVLVLARANGDPVLIRQGRVLAATFHPEMTPDLRVHRYFIEEVQNHRASKD
jgi:pyridoxal 5'-phosphate synthase pdxT subunit